MIIFFYYSKSKIQEPRTKMKYISIGNACNSKMAIQKYIGPCETLFFDWLMTDMKSILAVLQCQNIEDILQPKYIVQDNDKPIHETMARIRIQSLSHCISIHDLKINYTEMDVLQMIEKYKRRYDRIHEWIQSNEKLCFIRVGKMNPKECLEFMETILDKNPRCDFLVVNIYNGANESIQKRDRFIEIIQANEEKTIDWTKVFQEIECFAYIELPLISEARPD